MLGDVTVTVTWTDGREETYRGFQATVDPGNNLIISQRMHTGLPRRVIPLGSVRFFTVTES